MRADDDERDGARKRSFAALELKTVIREDHGARRRRRTGVCARIAGTDAGFESVRHVRGTNGDGVR